MSYKKIKKWDSSLSALSNSCTNLHSGDCTETLGMAPGMSGPQRSLALCTQEKGSITRWTIHSKVSHPGRMQEKEDVAWMHGHQHHPLVE